MGFLHFSSMTQASLTILSFGSAASALTQQSACYNPDGTLAQGNFPCFLEQENSPCCGGSTICEDSGLCKVLDSTGVSDLIRGTCTDPTWGSQECPLYCMGALHGGVNVISCENVTHSDLDFCCDGHAGCCDSGIGRFQIGFNTDIVTIGTGGVTVSTFATTTTSSSSSTTTTMSTSSTTTSWSSASSTASSGSPSNTSGSNAPVEKSSSGLSIGAKAAIGVICGVVGLAIIAALVYFFLVRKKESKGTAPRDDAVEVRSYEPPSHEPPKEMDSRAHPAEIMARERDHLIELSANEG